MQKFVEMQEKAVKHENFGADLVSAKKMKLYDFTSNQQLEICISIMGKILKVSTTKLSVLKTINLEKQWSKYVQEK